MPVKDKEGNWLNSQGKAVPPGYVPKADKLRDRLVERHFAKAEKVRAAMATLKEATNEAVADHIETLFTEHGVKPNDGGNYTLTNFAGTQQVAVKVQHFMDFDERIEAAKAIVDECLEKWAEGGHENLRVIVTEAFRVRDKRGLDVKSILALRNYKMKDNTGRWQEAMDLITESLHVDRSRAYLQFRSRATSSSDWQTLSLDLAGV